MIPLLRALAYAVVISPVGIETKHHACAVMDCMIRELEADGTRRQYPRIIATFVWYALGLRAQFGPFQGVFGR